MKEENTKSVGSKVAAVIGTTVLVAASVTGGWVACEMWPKAPAGAGVDMRAAMMNAPVTVAITNAELRAYNLPEKFVAHAEAMQEVDLLPQVDGYIKEITFKEGDLVKEGQVLYIIDDERYQAVVNQRKADLAAAEAEERRAARYYERMQTADERGITQLERDNAEAGAESSKAAVLQAKANLVVAEYDLKKTKVIAPINGQIGKTSAHVGDYVAPSKGPLARIVQTDPIRVTFPLTDRQYIAWRQGVVSGKKNELQKRMRVVLPDGTVYDKEGTFDFDDNTMSESTATIVMRLRFANPDRLLVPNTFVNLLADSYTPPKYPSVPQTAIFDLPGGHVGVWLVKDDNTVTARVVTTLEMFKGWVPILSGLEAGDKVVTSGTGKLREGAHIIVVQPTSNDENDPNHKSFGEVTK